MSPAAPGGTVRMRALMPGERLDLRGLGRDASVAATSEAVPLAADGAAAAFALP